MGRVNVIGRRAKERDRYFYLSFSYWNIFILKITYNMIYLYLHPEFLRRIEHRIDLQHSVGQNSSVHTGRPYWSGNFADYIGFADYTDQETGC